MRKLVLLLVTSLCSGAVSNVRVLGTTATQAALAYTAPTDSACTVEVSEQSGYSPVVHDVNAALFSGASSDSRAGNLTTGRGRVFVVGKRAAEAAADGLYYSRALQTFTQHYYRITCGADTATGAFRTANIPVGKTSPEIYPVDPSNPGRYAWPNATPTAYSNDTMVDPLTGALIRRVAGPKTFYNTYTGRTSIGAYDDSGSPTSWSTTGGGALPATYTASGADCTPNCARLYVPSSELYSYFTADDSPSYAYPSWFKATLTYTYSGAATYNYCLTIGGSDTCAPGAKTLSVNLATCGSPCVLGDTEPYFTYWFTPVPANFEPEMDVAKRTTTASYDNGTGVLAWSSGDYFNPKWAGGARIQVGAAYYKVNSVSGPKSVTLASGLGLSNPVSLTTLTYGLLIWKADATTGSLTLTNATFDVGVAIRWFYSSSTSPDFCAKTLKTGPGSALGYRCVVPTWGSGSVWTWTNSATGETNVVGTAKIPAITGVGATTLLEPSPMTIPQDDSDKLYAAVLDTSSNLVLVRSTYTGPAGAPNTCCGTTAQGANIIPYANPGAFAAADTTNLTAAPNHLEKLLHDFDADAASPLTGFKDQYGSLQVQTVGGTDRVLIYTRSSQDTAPGAWLVVYNPGTGTVVAATNTHGASGGTYNRTSSPLRWCASHTAGGVADNGWFAISAKSCAATGGGGQFRTTLAVAMTATDTQLTATGEPGAGALDIARVGDYLVVDSERMKINGKPGGNVWTVLRAGDPGCDRCVGPKAAHSSGVTVVMACTAETLVAGYLGGGRIFWDYVNDPHGLNAGASTVINDYDASSHGTVRPLVQTYWQNTTYSTRWTTSMSQVTGAYQGTVPLFHSFAGVTPYTTTLEAHPMRNQWLSAGAWEKRWVLDSHPLYDMTPMSNYAQTVTGSLYKIWKTSGGTKLTLNRKQFPTMAWCGTRPLLDISSTTATITGGTSDNYKYCVANATGECYAGSAAGDVYVNCPYLTYPASLPGNACNVNQTDSNTNFTTDICLFAPISRAGVTLSQTSTLENGEGDDNGQKTFRVITYGFGRYRRQPAYLYGTGHAAPDGTFALFTARGLDGMGDQTMLAKLPPFPFPESVNRKTFIPLRIGLGSVPSGTNNVVVEFGYNPSFHCTSRAEVCVANAATVSEATPFYFASESFSGLTCAAGCTVAVPALSQRVAYYRVKYRDAGNTVIAIGATQVAAVP